MRVYRAQWATAPERPALAETPTRKSMGHGAEMYDELAWL